MKSNSNQGQPSDAGGRKTERYPEYIGEVLQLFEKYKTFDCYPRIAPALLNSADIKAYVKKTGMIFPFHEEDLQSASYKVRIAGKVKYWVYDEKKVQIGKSKVKPVTKELEKKGDYFDLQPNSIAFVTLEPEFHIPYYIALRFNLKIKHIYKGLLLGTGPLVDPGFQGKLSIPLHNLTNNTYRFRYGDTLITMEFTKLSPNEEWYERCPDLGHEEPFWKEDIPASRDVETYINNALKDDRLTSIISSIPDSIYESKKQAQKARKDVKKIRHQSAWITAGSIVSVMAAVLTSARWAYDAINKANERYDKIVTDNSNYSIRISDLDKEITSLKEYIQELEKKIEELEKQNEEQDAQDSEAD